jgi:membrane protease YdiL (CAAX protease family)
VIALLVLAIAVVMCALIVFFGPGVAEMLVQMFSGAQQQNLPLLETVFSSVIFGSLLLCALIGGAVSGLNPLKLGRKRLKMIGIGATVGLFGILVAAFYAGIHGALASGPAAPRSPTVLLWGVALILFQTGSEEIYFRGWLQKVLARDWGAWAGIIVAAIAFAGLHVMGGARSPTSLLNLFLGGLLFGFLASYGRGIAAAWAAHFAWNACEQLLLGLDPNPGLGSFGAFMDLELTGTPLWGGSDEGLNASIAMTVALLALIVPLLIMATGRRPMDEQPKPASAASPLAAGSAPR